MAQVPPGQKGFFWQDVEAGKHDGSAYANGPARSAEELSEMFDKFFGKGWYKDAEEKPAKMEKKDYIIRAAKTCVEMGPSHPDVVRLVRALSARTGTNGNGCWYMINLMSQGDLRR